MAITHLGNIELSEIARGSNHWELYTELLGQFMLAYGTDIYKKKFAVFVSVIAESGCCYETLWHRQITHEKMNSLKQ